MNFKQKLVYMALGCLFTLIGYTLATLTTTTTAQTDEIVDEIVCRKLKVVDSENRTVAVIEESGTEIISIYNPKGKLTVQLGANKREGFIAINHESGKRAVAMGADNLYEDGFIQMNNKNGTGRIRLSSGIQDSGIWIQKGREIVFSASSMLDNGVISVYDVDGDLTGQMPSKDILRKSLHKSVKKSLEP